MKIEVRIGAGLPTVGKKMMVELVATVAFRMVQDEALLDLRKAWIGWPMTFG